MEAVAALVAALCTGRVYRFPLRGDFPGQIFPAAEGNVALMTETTNPAMQALIGRGFQFSGERGTAAWAYSAEPGLACTL